MSSVSNCKCSCHDYNFVNHGSNQCCKNMIDKYEEIDYDYSNYDDDDYDYQLTAADIGLDKRD